jgi:hypothetical protein
MHGLTSVPLVSWDASAPFGRCSRPIPSAFSPSPPCSFNVLVFPIHSLVAQRGLEFFAQAIINVITDLHIEPMSIRRFPSGILTQLGNCLAEEVL